MTHLTKETLESGQILLLNKPLKWTSFQAVNKIKYTLHKYFELPKRFKIGHAGTLDPLASGLLIVCTGKFTKKISEIQNQVKEYTGRIFLGATTPSYDLETEVNAHFSIEHITKEMIEETRLSFLGKTQQFPPIFSAIKKDGKRLYEHARAGEEVEITSREINIYQFDVKQINAKELDFRILCSKGTYIRSIAHDFGKKLNSGAHLSALRRTKIGEFNVADAFSPVEFEDLLTQNKL